MTTTTKDTLATVRVEFYILWDDQTWSDSHYFDCPISDGSEELAAGGSMVLDAATRYANNHILPTQNKACFMIAVNDDPGQDLD